jgi:hypothetical protein
VPLCSYQFRVRIQCSPSATARFPRRFSDKSRGLFTSILNNRGVFVRFWRTSESAILSYFRQNYATKTTMTNDNGNLIFPISPKTAQEMKYVFWTRALNTDMRIKYEEMFNGSPKSFGGMWKEYRFVQPHNLLFGVELSADKISVKLAIIHPQTRKWVNFFYAVVKSLWTIPSRSDWLGFPVIPRSNLRCIVSCYFAVIHLYIRRMRSFPCGIV